MTTTKGREKKRKESKRKIRERKWSREKGKSEKAQRDKIETVCRKTEKKRKEGFTLNCLKKIIRTIVFASI